MKLKSLACFFILIFCSSSILLADTSVNGRFVVMSIDSLHYTVNFQINTDANKDTLGCSTIIFNFDTSSIAFPASPVENTDYKFLNFHGDYYVSTVTRPLLNQIWINIVSMYPNEGTAAAQSPGWTDVVQLTFEIIKKKGSSNLVWQSSDNNWAVYDIDNSTILQPGSWINENTSLSENYVAGNNTDNQTPKEFRLFQNYPNPFNPSTVINYSIAKPGRVVLKVYDLLGREVSTLVDKNEDAGKYTVTFSAVNLASGVYVYILKSGSFVSTNKMVLLK